MRYLTIIKVLEIILVPAGVVKLIKKYKLDARIQEIGET